MKIRIMTALSAAAVLVAASGCAAETTQTESGVNLVQDGSLTVCTQFPYEPFEYLESGTPKGFDMEIMKALAKKEGLEFNVKNTAFEGIQSGQSLNTGTCDIAAAAMTITPEREKVIDFTDPYFDATQALLVQKGSGYDSLESLAGKSIGVQTGTTGEIYAKENAPKDAELRTFEDLGLLTQAVAAGQIDGAVQDNAPVRAFAEKDPSTEVTAEFDTGESYGFAVKKGGNAQLLEDANALIGRIKQDGTYDKLYKQAFGIEPSA